MDFNMSVSTMPQPVQSTSQPVQSAPQPSFKQDTQASTSSSLDKTMQDLADKVNLEYKDTHKSQGIDIGEIKSLNNFNPTEILASKNQSSSFESLNQEDKMDMAHAIAKNNFDFYNKERKNYSEEANQLMEKIKRGHIPDDKENRILLSEENWLQDNKSKLDTVDKLNELKQRISGGRINGKDFDSLLEIVGFDDEMSNLLRQEFASKGILIDEYDNVNSEDSKAL